MTRCGGAALVETGRMVEHAIGWWPGLRRDRGGRFGRWDTCGRLDTSGGKRGHVVANTAWGIDLAVVGCGLRFDVVSL